LGLFRRECETSISEDEKGITVNIYRRNYQKLRERKYNIKSYINSLVEKDLLRMELAEKLKPYLRIVSAEDKSIYVKDDKINQVVEVRASTSNNDRLELRCLHDDDSDSCVHVAYCLGRNDWMAKIT